MLKSAWYGILLVAALVAVALFADAWRSGRRDSVRLAATLSSQKAALQQAADREKERDIQLSAALATIAANKLKIQTPRQAARAIPSVLPPLPLPISIRFSEPSAAQVPADPPAASPAIVSIPQADLVPLYDDLQDCRTRRSARRNVSAAPAKTGQMVRYRS